MAIYTMKYGRDHVKPANSGSGGLSCVLCEGKEGSSQSFKKGALLTTSSGKIVTAAVASSKVSNVIGVAAHDASGTASTPVLFYPVKSDMEFTAVVNGSTGSAANYTLKQSDVGVAYGMRVDTSTKAWYIDKTVTTAANTNVVVVRLLDPAETVLGRAVIKFRTTNTIY